MTRRIIFILAIRDLFLRFIVNHSSLLMRRSIIIVFILGIKYRRISPSRLNRIIKRAFSTHYGLALKCEIEALPVEDLDIISQAIEPTLDIEVVEPLYKLLAEKLQKRDCA